MTEKSEWRRLVPEWWRKRPSVPLELTAVAIVIGVEGVLAMVPLLAGLIHGRFELNFGVLGIALSAGLLVLNRTAYRLTKVVLWFAAFGIVSFVLALIATGGLAGAMNKVTELREIRVWALLFGSAAQTAWQLRVLLRDDVAELFDAHSAFPALTRSRKALGIRDLQALHEADGRRALRSSDDGFASRRRIESAVLTVSRPFQSSAHQVFDQWIDANSLRRFLVGSVDGSGVRSTADPSVGGPFWVSDERGEWRVEHTGAYMEIARPDRLVYIYSPSRGMVPVQVTIQLAPSADGCVLTLMQERNARWMETVDEGTLRWTKVLDNLHRLLSLHPPDTPRISFPA